jgi:hypothetical protein
MRKIGWNKRVERQVKVRMNGGLGMIKKKYLRRSKQQKVEVEESGVSWSGERTQSLIRRR